MMAESGKSTIDGLRSDMHVIRARRLGIDTQYEAIIFMRKDCYVCRAEGFAAHARVEVHHANRVIIATLYQVTSDLLHHNEVGLSEAAWRRLHLYEGGQITVSHPPLLESLSLVRGKIYGRRFDDTSLHAIVSDIAVGQYSDIHLSSLITACSARPLDFDETVWLTRAMVDVGEVLQWKIRPVMDKHCVGGLPGNRTTPIVVAIAAACGLTIPKTSSRAITSPAGTADTMETMAPVSLDTAAIRQVVEREGGCIVWGGAVRLSPADDVLIRVERALDLDSEGQLVASVLSKKIAAGSTHLVLDLPIGPTAKIRTDAVADAVANSLLAVSKVFGLETRVLRTDGTQPVGRGIGPALEARDVLAVLQNAPQAPADLRDKAVALAAELLELAGVGKEGKIQAAEILRDGRAWRKFQAICEAQGGMRVPAESSHRHPVLSTRKGRIDAINNRKIARVAKLAGAPDAKAAGVELHCRLGVSVDPGQPLYTVHAEAPGELDYALAFVAANNDIVTVNEF
jgi:thymidine phosphorylase